MKTGKTLVELATEIERQRDSRVDYIAPTEKLSLVPVTEEDNSQDVYLTGLPDRVAALNDLAHGQVAAHTDIPKSYYDKMRREAPALLIDNVNHWFHDKPSKRMVRTLDGRVRAFLSDSYRPLENADLAEAVLPVLMENKNLELVSSEITERRLYIKAVDKRVVREIEGRRYVDGRAVDYDHISPSITISNSEVGCGLLSVETGAYTHECRNMALFRERSLKKRHVGGKHELAEDLVHLLSDETKRATDKAVWMQVRDVVRGAFDETQFDERMKELQGLTAQKIEGDVVKVVDLAAKTLDIRELEKPSILRHLIEGGDLSRYGLFNAVTRTAEDLSDYDRATEFERMGGKLIELPANDWERIARAA